MSRPVKHGSTDQAVVVRIIDSADGTPETGVNSGTGGLALWYRREGGLKVTITPASLSALDAAHADGGILHISDGYYRIDVPDAAFAASAAGVMIGGAVTGMIVIGTYVPLVANVESDTYARLGAPAGASLAADVAEIPDQVWDEATAGHVSAGSFGEQLKTDLDSILVAVGTDGVKLLAATQTSINAIEADTNEIQGKLPPGTISNLTTTDILNQAKAALDAPVPGSPTQHSINERVAAIDDKLPAGMLSDFDPSADLVNVGEINSDATAAARLASSAGSMVAGAVAASPTPTATQFAFAGAASAVDDFYNGRTVIFTTGNLSKQQRQITDYTGATKLLTVGALTSAPADGDEFIVV